MIRIALYVGDSTGLKILKDYINKNLDNFLLNPKKWVPGTQMSFVGIKKDNDRANIIKYLQSL